MSCLARTALLALALAAALSACGSTSTTTVTAKGEPPSTSSTASTTRSTPSSTTSTTQTSGAGGGASTTPAKTHTAPEPAFAEGEAKAGSRASAAAALLRGRGYSPVDVAQYHEGQTLGVLVGRRAGSAPAEQAFFFLDGHFLGTDTKEPSASLQVLSQNDTEVTLAYTLYRSGDSSDSPSGGRAVVDFQLNDGKLQAIGAIPPVDAASAPSRR